MGSLLAVGAAFVFGFVWQSPHKTRGETPRLAPDRAIDPQARAAALELLDEALRAQREGRINGALSALDRARRTDPSLPGVDVSFATLAFGENEFAEMRTAAAAAVKKNEHAAEGNVLLGMDKWIGRGASDREMSSGADAASARFSDATEADYFHAPAWFFWGDVLRYAGREREGHLRSLAALHRFDPWDSSDVLAAKIIFASAEAGMPTFFGLGIDEDSPWVRAVADSVRAARLNAPSPPAALPSYTAQRIVGALAEDPFFVAGSGDSPQAP